MIEEIVKGDLRVCPRCKGHGYILGQEKYKNDKNIDIKVYLPNYNHNKKGLCFLCDGKKEAFFAYDNRVFKFKKNRRYKTTKLIEFCPYSGDLIGEICESEYEELKSYYASFFDAKEAFFPKNYEDILGKSNKIIDAILQEYEYAKVIQINEDNSFENEYDDEIEDEYSVDFNLYYDKDFNLINPFYVQPTFSKDDRLYVGTIIALDEASIGVGGVYLKSCNNIYLGIKFNDDFKDDTVENIKELFNLHKSELNLKNIDILNFKNDEKVFEMLTLKIISDIQALTGINMFNR